LCYRDVETGLRIEKTNRIKMATKVNKNPTITFTQDAIRVEAGDAKTSGKLNDKLFNFIPLLALVFLIGFVAFMLYTKKYEQLTAFDFILVVVFAILLIRDRISSKTKIVAETIERDAIKEVIFSEQLSGNIMKVKRHKGLALSAQISDQPEEVLELVGLLKDNGIAVNLNEKLKNTFEENGLNFS